MEAFWFKPDDPRHHPPVINDFFLNKTTKLLTLLVINGFLAIFLNFIILTQSASLGSFKYYLLNQAVWTQLVEIDYLITSPVVFCPYLGGIVGGILRETTSAEMSIIWNIIGFSLTAHCMFSVCLTLSNRFIFLFRPDSKKYLQSKCTFAILVSIHLFFDGAFFIMGMMAKVDHNELVQEAKNDSGNT
uniref:7TM GPCR serpentine receptor class x (Srx) domain-containing protein n=1 Tax=Panagrellus redivivus TaxID=6233 RepID=A0A7E4VBU9_PANRE